MNQPVSPDDIETELVVLGAGPGGYTAAFRAADLGLRVVLVDAGATLGGVCLNVGCIPSKALLHAAKVITDASDMTAHGVSFGSPEVDLERLREWKSGVVKRLTGGLVGLARKRRVSTVQGTGRFVSDHQIEVLTDAGTRRVTFETAIIAVGSRPVQLPFIPHGDPRVLDSTGALDLTDVPNRLLVIGGGIIGLEMATVYSALGASITVVEVMDQIIPGADPDIVRPLFRRIEKQYENVYLGTRVIEVRPVDDGLQVTFDGPRAPSSETFDKALVAVGRTPNGATVGAEAAGVTVDERGFIPVDSSLRTTVPHIFAIGDVVGQPMLAHKASAEGKVAAENAAGSDRRFDGRAIPAVAYTDPEVAWVGLTELQAKATGVDVGTAGFPWAANGRSLTLGRQEGFTKLILDSATGRLLGCGIVGPAAGDLIAEATLAIELGADAAGIGGTVHPHPTLSETIAMAAETFEGTITDLYVPRPATAGTATASGR
jgi:dihydrolipoamide dehydrogenase